MFLETNRKYVEMRKRERFEDYLSVNLSKIVPKVETGKREELINSYALIFLYVCVGYHPFKE
jgi:hypothetical protein